MQTVDWVNFSLIAVGIFIVILMLYLIFSRFSSKRSISTEIDVHYLQGLEALVDRDYESAISYLKKAARTDSSSIGPFLVLGDLMRERGNVERAIQIHRELTIRTNLDKATEKRVYKSLTLDYLTARKFNQVISASKRLLSYDKNDQFALNSLLRAYEEERRWDDAVGIAKELANRTNGSREKFLSHYQAYVGGELLDSQPDQSEKYLRNAISIDKSCTPGFIYLGDSYFQKSNIEKAIETWNELIENNPNDAHLVFDRIEKAYFELGNYGRLVEFYEALQDKLPEDDRIRLRLAQIYRRKGEFEAALSAAKRALELNPKNRDVYSLLVEIYHEDGKTDETIDLIRGLFKQSKQARRPYTCEHCHSDFREPFWRCPKCKEWRLAFS